MFPLGFYHSKPRMLCTTLHKFKIQRAGLQTDLLTQYENYVPQQPEFVMT